MTSQEAAGPVDLEETPRALVLLASRGFSRTAFLREASRLLLHATAAESVTLWLQDGDLQLSWEARRRPQPSSGFLSVAPREGGLPSGDGGAQGDEPALEVLVPFQIDESARGVLEARGSRTAPLLPDRVAALEGLAQVLGAAFAGRRAQAARIERVKELNCMYGIAEVSADPALSISAVLARVVDLLPPAWQHPELTTARIVVDDGVYLSRDFAEGAHRLATPISQPGKPPCGAVEVFCSARAADPQEAMLLEAAPFLEEEGSLIRGVAQKLGLMIERKQSQAERLRLHEQIRRADRLATIGQLAAGIAHELNEPLGNILGFAQLAAKTPDLPVQVGKDLDRIVIASLYGREVIKKLMFFSRQTPARTADLDINRVVEAGLSLLETRAAKAGTAIEPNLDPRLPPVDGDEAQLQQIVVNLLVNAIQAMPGGGTIQLRSRRHEGLVSLEVEDDGDGISSEALPRIFEPFFTTKDVGQGTGLGLSVVHGIVTAHGGTVTVRSEPGTGALFRVLLPVAAPERPEGGT